MKVKYKNNYKHLSSEERDKIAILRAQGYSLNKIAKMINRNKSTISRELRRNSSPTYDVYLPHNAIQRAKSDFPISGNGTLGSFEGNISYNPTVAALTVSLTNTSPVDNGGYITAFAFNNTFDSITDVSLSSTDSDFVLLGGSSF